MTHSREVSFGDTQDRESEEWSRKDRWQRNRCPHLEIRFLWKAAFPLLKGIGKSGGGPAGDIFYAVKGDNGTHY